MTFLTKLIYAGLTTTVITGGGVGIGLSATKQSNSVNKIDLLTATRQQEGTALNLSEEGVTTTAENTLLTGVVTEVTHLHTPTHTEQVESETQDTQTASAGTEKERFEEAQDEGIGKCVVIEGDSEVIGKLSLGVTYFSVSCDNSEVSEVDLEKWIGIFPSALLKDGGKGLIAGKHFDIDVSYQDVSDDYEGEESYQTLFTSDKFVDGKIIGRWGSSLGYAKDDSIVVYTVEVADLTTSSYFYISKKA